MIQLILHLWGDYILQSGWMANNKTKAWFPAIAHATIYSLPFLLIGSWQAVFVIWSTHAVIDRFRLARYVCWAKNFIGPLYTSETSVIVVPDSNGTVFTNRGPGRWEEKTVITRGNPVFSECSVTGYPATVPVWLSTWLMIIADNTLHLTINFLALKYL